MENDIEYVLYVPSKHGITPAQSLFLSTIWHILLLYNERDFKEVCCILVYVQM